MLLIQQKEEELVGAKRRGTIVPVFFLGVAAHFTTARSSCLLAFCARGLRLICELLNVLFIYSDSPNSQMDDGRNRRQINPPSVRHVIGNFLAGVSDCGGGRLSIQLRFVYVWFLSNGGHCLVSSITRAIKIWFDIFSLFLFFIPTQKPHGKSPQRARAICLALASSVPLRMMDAGSRARAKMEGTTSTEEQRRRLPLFFVRTCNGRLTQRPGTQWGLDLSLLVIAL